MTQPQQPDSWIHSRFMSYLFMAGLVLCLVILGLFLWEGVQDKQNLDAVMKVGGQAVRDLSLTLSSPILVSVEDEKKWGRAILSRIRWLPEHHPETQRVRRIGRRLARYCRRTLSFQFYVVSSWQPNAFAIPGGYILVTTGLLRMVRPDADDAELAWVLAHELSHLERQHAWLPIRMWILRQRWSGSVLQEPARVSQVLAYWMRMAYTQNMELEADCDALVLMNLADFQPQRALTLMERMKNFSPPQTTTSSRHPWLIGIHVLEQTIRHYQTSHPHWEERKKAMEQILKKIPSRVQ